MLYFNYLDQSEYADTCFVLFDGNLANARAIAHSDEPCWEMNMKTSHSFVADVTRFILTMSHPNQDYSVVLPFDVAVNTSGENPWNASYGGPRLFEGATLIIVYRTEESEGTVYIYDRLNESMFSKSGIFHLFHPGVDSAEALFTLIGADGREAEGMIMSCRMRKRFSMEYR